MTAYKLWENAPGLCCEEPILEYYPAENKKTDASVVIFPGGGYNHRAAHEGGEYALFLNSIGMDAFVCQYRVWPHQYPLPLLDARRAVRFVRSKAAEFGLDPEKVAVMGSSAGGHLSALVSNYKEPIEFEGIDEIDSISPIPNASILCYAVVHAPDEEGIGHAGCYLTLAGEETDYEKLAPDLHVTENTPPAFIWHTANDSVVHVGNAYLYALALRKYHIPHELHTFAKGRHGLGLAKGWSYIEQWSTLLHHWLMHIGWLPEEDGTWR